MLGFEDWETGGITALMNRKGQGRKPILSLQNKEQVAQVKALIAKNPQSVKSVVAALEPQLRVKMHVETLKRFLKNLVSASAASAPASSRGKWRMNAKRARQR